MPQPRKQPSRSVLILARSITVIVGLAGAEGILWFAGYPNWWPMLRTPGDTSSYAPDPDLGWKNREGQFDAFDPVRNVPFRYTNWSQGRRSTADREPGDSSAPRVLFFGDSYVQGFGLSNEQTFAWVVQKTHPEMVVSNFGTAGYGTYQSLLAMEKHACKDCSVFYLFNSFHERRNVGEPDFLRIVKRVPGWSFPYVELEDGKLQAHVSEGEMVWPISRWLRLGAMAQDYYQRVTTYRRMHTQRSVTEALLVKMNETVQASGGRFTLILFDMKPEERGDYRQFVQARAIPFIDCNEAEMTNRSLLLSDGHPNEELNRLLAHWIEPLPVLGSLR
jgi:lysophospholipase L1-like esterase